MQLNDIKCDHSGSIISGALLTNDQLITADSNGVCKWWKIVDNDNKQMPDQSMFAVTAISQLCPTQSIIIVGYAFVILS
jgi:hypothetical protein